MHDRGADWSNMLFPMIAFKTGKDHPRSKSSLLEVMKKVGQASTDCHSFLFKSALIFPTQTR